MSLYVLIPRPIADADLLACSVPIPDPAFEQPDGTVGEQVWVSGTSYPEDTRVIRPTTRRRYRRSAVTGSNTARPERSPLLWIDEGVANRWAWADTEASTATASSSPFSLTVRPGVCNSIELYAMTNVDTISVTMTLPGGQVVYSLETSTDEYSGVDPHWSFYFEGPMQGNTFSLTGLPVYADAQVTIELSSYDGEPLSVGLIAMGSYEFLGLSQFGFEVVHRDYGYTITDRWQQPQKIPGPKGKDLRGSAILEVHEANGVEETIRRLLDVGAIFVPSLNPEHRYLKTWGQLKPARISAAGPTHAVVEIDVEGLF